jgi:uncharacterized protein
MTLISLSIASAITGLTKRTLWRHIDSGRITATSPHKPGQPTRVRLQDITPISVLSLQPEHHSLLIQADQGNAIAQCDLGLLLLQANRPTDALPWLKLSAKQHYPDAMCFLGRCTLSGTGTERNLETGVMWINQAAVKGHPLSQALLRFLQNEPGQKLLHSQNPTALDAALDDIERQTLLKALEATADTP